MAYAPLSLLEREEIRVAIVEDPGVAFAVIGVRIGRDRSTVSREVSRNGGRHGYRAAMQPIGEIHQVRSSKSTTCGWGCGVVAG